MSRGFERASITQFMGKIFTDQVMARGECLCGQDGSFADCTPCRATYPR